MKLTPDEERELLGMLSAELREAEATLAHAPADARERAERRVRILRRATGNVALRVKQMNVEPLAGAVAHGDVVQAARTFVESQLGTAGNHIVRSIIGNTESRVRVFEVSGDVAAEVGGCEVADHDAFGALLAAVASFVTTALSHLDQAKRKAIKEALDRGLVVGVDVHTLSGFATLSVGAGDEAVLVCAVNAASNQLAGTATH